MPSRRSGKLSRYVLLVYKKCRNDVFTKNVLQVVALDLFHSRVTLGELRNSSFIVIHSSLYDLRMHFGTSLRVRKVMIENVVRPLVDIIVIVTFLPSDLN